MVPVPESLELVVIYNGAMEPPYAARRRALLRERQAELLQEMDARVASVPPPLEPIAALVPDLIDLAAYDADDYVDLIGRVIRDAYPRILTNQDVATTVLGARRQTASILAQFSRARLALEGLGRVVRCGYTPSPSGTGRHRLQFRWVPDAEWTPQVPLTPEERAERDHGPRSLAAVLARVRAHLAAIYPSAATHADLLAAIAPNASHDDESLLRTITKARLALEERGEAVRPVSARSMPAIQVRLSATAKAALDRRSACSA